MYRIINTKPKFGLLFFKVKQNNQFLCKSLQKINYHSSSGVYGYRPRTLINFESGISLNTNYMNKGYQISQAFRNHGYKLASLNPLKNETSGFLPFLDPANYGLELGENQSFELEGIPNFSESVISVDDFFQLMKRIYCDKIGIEILNLPEHEKQWFGDEFERIQLKTSLTNNEKKELAQELIKSQVFDNFLATKFVTLKRYGGEGAESATVFFMEVLKQSCLSEVKDVIIGMPHRGRLNIFTGLLNYPPVEMFNKMKGSPEFPDDIDATGDVLHHLTISTEYEFKKKSVNVSVLPNPSHLEAVSPVVMGFTRSRLQSINAADYKIKPEDPLSYPILPIQVHGDASFAGQGVVMETLAMSNVPHFSVGGSIHLVVNNQIGFTTPQERGKSSPHTTDLMKMIHAPIIHVNGDFPEEVLKATKLAFNYRQKFMKDVVINLFCFRRWGHNEMDDPTFTNPLMYKVIHSRKSVPDMYAESLIDKGILYKEDHDEMISSYQSFLNDSLKQTESHKAQLCGMQKNWKKDLSLKSCVSVWNTGVPVDLLKFVGSKSVEIPDELKVHPTVAKNVVKDRMQKLTEGRNIDWATAEALAFGSLIYQGHNVRISGQDVGRGTFSQRHAMVIDQSTGEMYIPLNHMTRNQSAHLEVANSILSEEGVLGFEYGFNVENTENLVIWEAQFGDFFNAAQVVFDTFISSGETKWLLPSNMVILLPHGYDGAGPEHSSSRFERFLQMCDSSETNIDSDDVNWHVVFPTTPAQYYHLLRRQIISSIKKPLIVVGPKILLRHPLAVSSLQEMSPGCHFQPVLDDATADAKNVKTVLFCTGKHFYSLMKEKENKKATDCAIIRLERLCPFPAEELYNILKNYSSAKNFVWCQEEHRNMGAWTFVQPRFRNILGRELKYVGREHLGTPAVGIGKLHQSETAKILKDVFV